MTTNSILSVIQHYQRSIEKCQTDEARLLHCISKLYKLPVKVEHLQETGIGKTVNSLRKFDGEIGAAAKALVAKWKAMVAAEEEPADTNCNQIEEEKSNDKDDESDEDHGDQNRNPEINNYEQNQNIDVRTKSSSSKELEPSEDNPKTSKEREKHSSSGSHHRASSNTHSTSSKHKSRSNHSTSGNEKHSEKRHRSSEKEENRDHKHEKHRERDNNDRRKDEKHKSSSSHKSSKSRKDENLNSNEDNQHHSKKDSLSSGKESKHNKTNSHEEEKHSSSTLKSKERKSQKDSVHEKHKSSSKESDHGREKKSKHSSSSTKEKELPSTPAVISTSSTSSDRKRRHNSDLNSSDSKSPKAKHVKQSKPPPGKEDGEDEEEEGIDSSMGANFADVLGMLNMPNKKSKKMLNSSKSPSINTNSSSQAKSSSGSKDKKLISTKYNGVNASTSGASTSRNSEVKLDLLSSSAKLEPLDPSIALELPTISANYKPMPLNKTVMDCVFASSSSSSYSNAPKAPVRTLTDAEALSHGISSKTMRTKIYSGVRTGQLMQVPSLFDLCIRILQKNIDALEYTGGVPFEVLRPVLERASPQQLLVFEEYNPYLMEDSDTLWKLHVQRHYRSQKRKEMESWREMFLRCQDDQERKLNILAESIKQSQKIIAAPVRKTQLAFVDSMVKPPRNVQRKQEQYGTKSKLIATPAARVASLSSVTPNAAKTGDARLRVAASVRDHAQVSNVVRPKKAPLMAKTLQFMRGRHKR